MKNLINLLLVLSLINCSSTEDAPPPPSPAPAAPPAGYNEQGAWCSGGVECIVVYVLVYGTAAAVQFFKNTKFKQYTPPESVPDGIVLKCYVQAPDKSALYPCGPFTVDVLEAKTNKNRSYSFTGDDNLIGFVKGRNRISVRLTECGLIQVADQVKAGDIIKLEFPATCRLAK